MTMARRKKIPEDMPAPEGAVAYTEQFFARNGSTAKRPTPSGRVEITFYDEDGAVVGSVHGSTGR